MRNRLTVLNEALLALSIGLLVVLWEQSQASSAFLGMLAVPLTILYRVLPALNSRPGSLSNLFQLWGLLAVCLFLLMFVFLDRFGVIRRLVHPTAAIVSVLSLAAYSMIGDETLHMPTVYFLLVELMFMILYVVLRSLGKSPFTTRRSTSLLLFHFLLWTWIASGTWPFFLPLVLCSISSIVIWCILTQLRTPTASPPEAV